MSACYREYSALAAIIGWDGVETLRSLDNGQWPSLVERLDSKRNRAIVEFGPNGARGAVEFTVRQRYAELIATHH